MPAPTEKEVDLKRTYDAVIVGSGAAGGMAAHVLTSHGMKVLLLEAGKKLDIEQRTEIDGVALRPSPPRRACRPIRTRSPTTNTPSASRPTPRDCRTSTSTPTWKVGPARTTPRTSSWMRKTIPTPASNYAWVRARCLGGKTNIWGRLALRLSDYDFKAASRDGYGEDWPISYADIAPYYDKVDLYLGISGHKENLPYLPDSIFQRSTRLNHGGSEAAREPGWNGPRADPLSRRRDHRRSEAQQIPQPVFRARRLRPARRRLRYPRGVRFAHRPDLSRAWTPATLRCERIPPSTKCWSTRTPAKRGAWRSSIPIPASITRPRRRSVLLAASTLESARLMLLSKSRLLSERHRQFQRPRGPQFLRARDGAARHRPGEGTGWQAAHPG